MNNKWKLGTAGLCFMLLGVQFYHAQVANLHGKVTNEEDAKIPNVEIRIKGTDNFVQSKEDGKFYFENLPYGNYTIVFSRQGKVFGEKEIVVGEGDNKLDFVFPMKYNQIQTIEIIGRKETGYKNTNSFIATKTETPILDVPQSINYVTKELINDQLAFKMMDVLKNVSGVSPSSYTNNKYILRGFISDDKQTLINGMKVYSGDKSSDVLPYVERVEVIKGPASALFSKTSPGGTINIVTKKPLHENRKSINFSTGSYGLIRISSDFTGPMNKSHTLLYRLNLAYQTAGSFRTLQDNKTLVIAPSVSFLPNENTKVNFDLVYVGDDGRKDRGQPSFTPVNGVQDLYAAPISLSLSRVNDYVKTQKIYSTLSLQHHFSDDLIFNAAYTKGAYHEDLREHRTANKNAVDENGKIIPNLMEMRYNYRILDNSTDNLTSYLTFHFNTGDVKHELLAGYDFIQSTDGLGNTTSEARGYLSADGKTAYKKYDPKKKDKYKIVDGRPVTNVPTIDLLHPDYTISDPSKYISTSVQDKLGKYYTHGVYLQDQLQWNQFHVLLSLRQEYYTDIFGYGTSSEKNVHQKALLPRVGVVYSPEENISIYGTYVYGFQPQNAGYIGDPKKYGGPFDPLKSSMVEFGVKSQWFHRQLSTTLALYHIEENNILKTANDKDNPDLLRQIGQIKGQGVELDVEGSILPNLSLIGNFALNSTKVTKSSNQKEIGRQASNAPKYQGGLWARYNFTDSMLKGVGVVFGVNYQSSRESIDYDVTLPSYTVANLGLYYSIDKIQLSAMLNNIFNKTYWIGADRFTRLFPGTPRNYLIGVGYKF